MSLRRAPWVVTSAASIPPPYILPRWKKCESASQWVAAWTDIDMKSSAETELPSDFPTTTARSPPTTSCRCRSTPPPTGTRSRTSSTAADATGRDLCRRGDHPGRRRNDIVPVARRLVTRGVLPTSPATAASRCCRRGRDRRRLKLRDVLDAQRVEVGPGDALLIRTGLLGATKRTGAWTEFATPARTCRTPLASPSTPCRSSTSSASARSPATTGRSSSYRRPARLPRPRAGARLHGHDPRRGLRARRPRRRLRRRRPLRVPLAGQPLPLRGGVGGPVNPMAVL